MRSLLPESVELRGDSPGARVKGIVVRKEQPHPVERLGERDLLGDVVHACEVDKGSRRERARVGWACLIGWCKVRVGWWRVELCHGLQQLGGVGWEWEEVCCGMRLGRDVLWYSVVRLGCRCDEVCCGLVSVGSEG